MLIQSEKTQENFQNGHSNPAMVLDINDPEMGDKDLYKEKYTKISSDTAENGTTPSSVNGLESQLQDTKSQISAKCSSHSFQQIPFQGFDGKSDPLNIKNKSFAKRIRIIKFCPPRGLFGTILSWSAFLAILYLVLIAIVGENALPGSNLFSLLVLIIVAQLGGILAEKIKLPPLLGMLIVGILLNNVPYVNIIGENIDPKWSATIRKMALVVILTRAGLGLDAQALRKLSLVVIRVGIVPNIVEMLIGSVVSHYLLSFPWLWSFLLGFIFSAVSPSVVVPCMLSLADRRLGKDKGVPTLVIAALSIDNALSISGIGVFLGIIFSSGSVIWQGFKGPVEVMAGIMFGIIMGLLCWYIPNRFEKGFSKFRFYFLFVLGLLSVFGSKWLKFGGAGAISCLTTAFVAEIGWRRQGWTNSKVHPVKTNFNFLWKFYQPFLFGLIGTEIQLSTLNGSNVALGLLTIAIGLVCRVLTCYLVLHGSALNVKEKIFTALSWLPKATIQAAFGSAALDMAQLLNKSNEETQEMIYGRQILTLAVLAIIVAAPIGAIIITITGPKLLKKSPEEASGEKSPEEARDEP